MKKLLSIVMLVCILASMCTVSAWADATVAVNGIYITGSGSDLREFFSFNLNNIDAETKLEMRLLRGNVLMSVTTPNIGSTSFPKYPITGNYTCAVWAHGPNRSSSWNTVWYEPISLDCQPDTYNLIVDDKVVTGAIIPREYTVYTKFESTNAPFAAKSNGIVSGYYQTLEDAVNNSESGSEIFIRKSGEYVLPDGQGKSIKFTSSVSGVVIDMQDSNGNYSSVDFGGDVVVNNKPAAPVEPPAPVNPSAPAATPAPVQNMYYIPATDDNSNMALWSILALALLTTAFVTRKRKAEN